MVSRADDLRATGRRQQRGAAVFIVVMVLTLLTAVGIWAVRAASMADMAAGFDREGSQAGLIAQYGITSTTAFLAAPSGDAFLTRLRDSGKSTTLGPDYCESSGLPPYPGGVAPVAARNNCLKLDIETIKSVFVAGGGSPLFAPTNQGSGIANVSSSLNVNETTNATFVVELTEGTLTGESKSGGGAQTMVTITAISQVRPAAACAAGLPMTSAGQQVMRAMITAGSGVK